ncbi:hypothetical protein SprV_0301245900 [Sparganum proliferum]
MQVYGSVRCASLAPKLEHPTGHLMVDSADCFILLKDETLFVLLCAAMDHRQVILAIDRRDNEGGTRAGFQHPEGGLRQQLARRARSPQLPTEPLCTRFPNSLEENEHAFCLNTSYVCQIYYAALDTNRIPFDGKSDVLYDADGKKVDIGRRPIVIAKLMEGVYKRVLAGDPTPQWLVIYRQFIGKVSIHFEPPLPSVVRLNSSYSFYLSVEVDPANPFFNHWLQAAKATDGYRFIYVNGQKVNVKEGYDGRPRADAEYESAVEVNNPDRLFKVVRKFGGNMTIAIHNEMPYVSYFSFRVAEDCPDWDFYSTFDIRHPALKGSTYCGHLSFNYLDLPPPRRFVRCTVLFNSITFVCSLHDRHMIVFRCNPHSFVSVGPKILIVQVTTEGSEYCVGQRNIEMPDHVFPNYEIILTPEQKYYPVAKNAFEIRLMYKHEALEFEFHTRLEDAWGNIVTHFTGNVASTEDAFCRKNITIICTIPEFKKIVKRVVQLEPMRTFNCSEEDVIVESAAEAKNLRLCRPVEAADQISLKNDKSYAHLLRDSLCEITGQVKQPSRAVGDFSKKIPGVREYKVKCQLFDYSWTFRVLINPLPKRKRCSPQPRRARNLPFIGLPLILGTTLIGAFLYFMVIVFVRHERWRRRTRGSLIPEDELREAVNRAGNNSLDDDPHILLAYTAFLENYSEERHERLKRIVSAYLQVDKWLSDVERRQAQRRKRWLNNVRSSTSERKESKFQLPRKASPQREWKYEDLYSVRPRSLLNVTANV